MSTKYSILYIDEEEDKRDDFLRDAEEDFEVEAIHPIAGLDNLIDLILSKKIDAIVVDFKLYEKDNTITYDGTNVIRELQKLKPYFPCFIFTNFDDDAVVDSDDVNYVYSKDVMTEHSGKITFKDRIKTQIKNYYKKMDAQENELLELIKKSNKSPLNAKEEARVVELDNLINHQLNRKIDVPVHLKSPEQGDKLEKLINISEEMIKILSAKRKA